MSKINGVVSKITDLQGFVASYLKDKKNPAPTTFKPFSNVRVTLATDFPAGFSNSFLPTTSLNATADATGKFQIDPGGLAELNRKAYFIVYTQTGSVNVPGAGTVPIFAPIYRSGTFGLKSATTAVQHIWAAPQSATEDSGITQAAVDQAVVAAKKDLNHKGAQLDTLGAHISDGDVHVTGTGRGATFKFDIKVKASTQNDLNKFIKPEMVNFDIDLPGPDVFTTLCVDEDAIQAQIQGGISSLVTGFNAKIKDTVITQIAASTGLPASAVKAFFDSEMTMTFWKLRYPVVGEKKFGPITIPVRSIVADPSFGFPRALFT